MLAYYITRDTVGEKSDKDKSKRGGEPHKGKWCRWEF